MRLKKWTYRKNFKASQNESNENNTTERCHEHTFPHLTLIHTVKRLSGGRILPNYQMHRLLLLLVIIIDQSVIRAVEFAVGAIPRFAVIP
ncbi:hypothetical protein Mapa_004448 [Marchantia paleacea]|nr:hypothetical protein Mapa_004448 [Marchantia paleacea]